MMPLNQFSNAYQHYTMNLQQQSSLTESLTPFSLPSAQSLDKRKPRFQRQKSNNKCDCHSTSKNKSSCDSLTLSHLYIKNSLIKPFTPSKNRLNEPISERISKKLMDSGQSGKKNLESTRIQNKNDSQQSQKSQINKIDQSQILVQGFLINSASSADSKKQTETLLKKAIFYREKNLKYETLIKDIRTKQSTLQTHAKILCQEIEQLKSQIVRLKRIIDDYINQDGETMASIKKFTNKNLTKLKEQYQIFRQEQKSSNQFYEKRHLEMNSKFQKLKHQNQQLKRDLAKQNELFNVKVKMMLQKQEFLQKTLSFTKNTLSQLQKDYEDKQGKILESKRLTEIIADKNKEIQTLKTKYQNIVKIINGQKKKNQTDRVQKNLAQKASIPSSPKSRHSVEVKSIVYNHRQNGETSCTIKTNIQKPKIVQNLIDKKIKSQKATGKESYQLSEVKKISKSKIPQMNQKIQAQNLVKNIKDSEKNIKDSENLKQTSSDLTCFSFNSLELSPQKSQN